MIQIFLLHEQRLEFLTEFGHDSRLDSKAIPKPTHKPNKVHSKARTRGFVKDAVQQEPNSKCQVTGSAIGELGGGSSVLTTGHT